MASIYIIWPSRSNSSAMWTSDLSCTCAQSTENLVFFASLVTLYLIPYNSAQRLGCDGVTGVQYQIQLGQLVPWLPAACIMSRKATNGGHEYKEMSHNTVPFVRISIQIISNVVHQDFHTILNRDHWRRCRDPLRCCRLFRNREKQC